MKYSATTKFPSVKPSKNEPHPLLADVAFWVFTQTRVDPKSFMDDLFANCVGV